MELAKWRGEPPGRHPHLGAAKWKRPKHTHHRNQGVQGAKAIMELAKWRGEPPGRHFNPGDSQVEIG